MAKRNYYDKEGKYYFQSRGRAYAFFLLELDGSIRMEKLGITRIHYMSKPRAVAWYKEVRGYIGQLHDDECMKRAENELNKLYEGMIR